MSEHYKFFQNKECEYFPCHKTEKTEDFNCLFCFCGGNFTYTEKGIKNCTNCMFPHKRENYEKVIQKLI